MLASVLSSTRSIEVNIEVVRIFTKLRGVPLTHKGILLKAGATGKTGNAKQLRYPYDICCAKGAVKSSKSTQ